MGFMGFGKYTNRAFVKAAKKLGLRPATMEEEYGEFADLKVEVRLMAERGCLAEFEPIFREHWERKTLLPDSSRLYANMIGWVTYGAPSRGDDPSTFAEILAPFEAEFRRNPTALTAGLYADVLHSTAFALRGGAVACKTISGQWQGMDHYFDLAREVMASVDPGEDPVWWSVRNAMLLGDDCTALERQEIGDKTLSLDPCNIYAYQLLAHQAMPRWYGTDASSIDQVARRAMASCNPTHRRGGYALVYWWLADISSFDVNDTAIEAALMVESCRDLLERFPTAVMRNIVARILSWSAIEDEVKRVFDAGLQAVVPMCWNESEDEEAIDRAARAYVWARHNS